jgi:RNA polymerase sigma factor (sigma-70 family)
MANEEDWVGWVQESSYLYQMQAKALKKGGPRHVSEFVAEATLQLVQACQKNAPASKSHFINLANRILSCCAAKYFRSDKKALSLDSSNLQGEALRNQLHDHLKSPSEQVRLNERDSNLWKQIKILSPVEQDVIVLQFVHKATGKLTSEILRIPTEQVYRIRISAMKKLRHSLRQH